MSGLRFTDWQSPDRRALLLGTATLAVLVTLPGAAQATEPAWPLVVRIESGDPVDAEAARRWIVAVSQALADVLGTTGAGRTVWVQVVSPALAGRAGVPV